MLPRHILDFLQRYEANTFTEDEHRQFLDWLRTAGTGEVEEVADRYRSVSEAKDARTSSYPGLSGSIEMALDEVDRKRAYRIPDERAGAHTGVPLYLRAWFRVAAAVLVIVCVTGLYFVIRQKGGSPAVVQQQSKAPVKDVLPGSNKAVLIRSDGSEVVLEDASEQTIKEKNGQEIANKDGALSYLNSGPGHAAGAGADNKESPSTEDKVMYNTVRVPRKGQYRLVLSDGTRVWLNSESSLVYPTAFIGADRRVEVTGEAYFEVAKNADRPFHVLHDKIDVQVLGTNFNVNSYADEKEATITLLEGSVNVSTSALAGSEAQLRPGQQARLNGNGKLRLVKGVDVDEVMAWKDGRFDFRDTDLKGMMRQLMRWYDVDVVYEGNIEDRFFTADISKNKNLSAVLKILEVSNIHCTIAGKTLIVKP